MRADGRFLRLAGPLVAALLAGALPAAAQVYGTAQVQYQNVDDVRVVVLADGSRVVRRFTSELLLKSIDVRHQSYLRQNLLMDSNLRFSEQSRPGGLDRTRTPAGTVRLLHPSFQLTAQHQPTTVRTTGTGAASVATLDTNRTTTTTRTAETMLLGNATAPGGLQFNASWLARRREGEGAVATERNVIRNARASLDRDRYSLYANAGDQVQKAGAEGAVRGRQRQYGFGGLWRLAPSKSASVTMQYDFGASRSQPGASAATTSSSQNAMLSGDWRRSDKLGASASYNWRRTGTVSSRSLSQSDQEAVLLGRWTPVRGASLTSGGGLRTQRDAAGRPRLLEYATAIAAGEGRVRPGWTTNASASHTTSWDPDRGTYGAQTLAGVTRMALAPQVSLDATLSLAANGDTAAASQRWSNIWTTRLNARPLRTLTFAAGVRGQRTGPGLLRPVALSRGVTLDVSWKPHPRLDVIGNHSINESLAGTRQRTRTWATNARGQVTDRWQVHGTWTRTAAPQLARGLESVATHDYASGRLLWQPTRRVAASVSLSSTDPGQELESRRVDGTFTWSFGR